jgi:hypothetical protein
VSFVDPGSRGRASPGEYRPESAKMTALARFGIGFALGSRRLWPGWRLARPSMVRECAAGLTPGPVRTAFRRRSPADQTAPTGSQNTRTRAASRTSATGELPRLARRVRA